MGLRCSIECKKCGKKFIIQEGGFTKKSNRVLFCPHCGQNNKVIFKRNGKIKIQ